MVKDKKDSINNLPLIPLKEMVIFPKIVSSLLIGRKKSLNAINSIIDNFSNEENKANYILVVTQKDITVEDPKINDLHKVGTLVEILQFTKLPDDTIKLLIKGVDRVELLNLKEEDKEFISADYKKLEEKIDYHLGALNDLKEELFNLFNKYNNSSKKVHQSIVTSIYKIDDISVIIDNIATHIGIRLEDKQKILETQDIIERLAYLNSILEIEIDLINVEKKIRDKVKKQIEKNQKDYYLNEQLKAIQKELQGSDNVKSEVDTLNEKLAKLKMSKEAKEKISAEIKKLATMSPISAEATVIRNYIDWCLALPWNNYKKSKIDLLKAEKILDSKHYGLNKVKERIIEYLAVLKKSGNLKAPILCFVGSPGVGKTSLGESIAKASGRDFVRISLGGIRDEAEIRGHRRTYIGAMPGKIIQAIRKASSNNPVILLDEIDKMSSDFRGDPAAALLEVLDPEQNSSFSDHYIELDYDLSKVMFITTANSFNIHEALLDRMEIIEISGYTEEEKLEIAKRHLIERDMKNNGIEKDEFSVTEGALVSLIRNYTRESGVRQLDREIDNLMRKTVKKLLTTKTKKVAVDENNLADFAGVKKFETSSREEDSKVGIVTGLAWTKVGGEILYIEAVKTPGKGNLKVTGKLGEVMKESIQAAYTLVFNKLGVDKSIFTENDFHVHVPEGATPKDGPSAGIAMVTAIYSVAKDIKVKNDVAMTGEITLRGKVLAIGGLKEKLLGALRAGIKTVIIPKDNEKDLVDLPKIILDNLKIEPVSNIEEVIDIALEKKSETQQKNKKN